MAIRKRKYRLMRAGQRYGRLTAIRRAGRDGHGNSIWYFHCRCGRHTKALVNSVRAGSTKSCGCLYRQRQIMRGQKFGRLTTIRRVGTSKWGGARWLFKCKCGNTHIAGAASVRRGRTQSCGCLRTQVARTNGLKAATHRMHGTPEYRAWVGLRDRCNNKRNKDWKDYGGRGIRVCKRWQRSFVAFYADMGRRPSARHSIDRIDNDGDYKPSNCRWATQSVQIRNRRRARRSRLQK